MEPKFSSQSYSIRFNELNETTNRCKNDAAKKNNTYNTYTGSSIELAIGHLQTVYDYKLPIEKIQKEAKTAFEELAAIVQEYEKDKESYKSDGLWLKAQSLVCRCFSLPQLLDKLDHVEKLIEAEPILDGKNPYDYNPNKEKYEEYRSLLVQQQTRLNALGREQSFLLWYLYVRYLQSPSVTSQELLMLFERIKKCKYRIYSSGFYMNPTSLCFSISSFPLIDKPLYISLYYFLSDEFKEIAGNKGRMDFGRFEWSFTDLFSEVSIIGRIFLAIAVDNSSSLKLFFEEYQKENPDKSLADLIAKYSLVGFAAANGCIGIMKYFIKEIKINLEQKFTLENQSENQSEKHYHHKDCILAKHKGCKLEMTPLALVLSTAPAMPRDLATSMVEVLVKGGANYNRRVIKTWTEMRGYFNQEVPYLKRLEIHLSTFDQSGILEEVKKGLKKTSSTKNEVSYSEMDKLRLEIKELKIEHEKQISELWKAIIKLQKEGAIEIAPKIETPPAHRGRGRGRGRGEHS